MKKVSIIYSATILEEMKNGVEDLGVKAYSIIATVYGKGLTTNPRYDNHVWPGKNQMMIIVCDEKSSKKIIEKINKLRVEFPSEGIVGFVENVENITRHQKENKL